LPKFPWLYDPGNCNKSCKSLILPNPQVFYSNPNNHQKAELSTDNTTDKERGNSSFLKKTVSSVASADKTLVAATC